MNLRISVLPKSFPQKLKAKIGATPTKGAAIPRNKKGIRVYYILLMYKREHTKNYFEIPALFCLANRGNFEKKKLVLNYTT